MLGLRLHVCFLPKQGHDLTEYEDAWAQQGATRLAVADGAGDAFEAAAWAKLLVRAFVHEPPISPCQQDFLDWLAAPIQAWNESIAWEQLPWYAWNKARLRGSFATLLGVTFVWPTAEEVGADKTEAPWVAVAVGDACLFHIRGTTVLESFPIEHSHDFSMTPPLVYTRPDYNHRSLAALQTREGTCRAGDLFVLATDALAEWFLHEIEMDAQPWQCLVGLTQDTFPLLITRLRQEGAMRNDDVTLIIGWVEDRNDVTNA